MSTHTTTTTPDWKSFLIGTGRFNEDTHKSVFEVLERAMALPHELIQSPQESWNGWLIDRGVTDSDIRSVIVATLARLKAGNQDSGSNKDVLAAATGKLEAVKRQALTEHEKNALWAVFRADVTLIATSVVTDKQLRDFLMKLANYTNTSTKAKLRSTCGYVFDGIISNAGQGASMIINVFKGTRALCAKVGPPRLEREFQFSKQIHSPVVMEFIEAVPIDQSRVALISPIYATTLREILAALGNEPAELAVLLNVALCGFSAICALSQAGLCHGDIKPGNFGVTSSKSNILTLFDFGSCRRLSDEGSLAEHTPKYLLDIELQDTTYLDLVCLFATIYEAAMRKLEIGMTRSNALEKLAECANSQILLKFAEPLCDPTLTLPAIKSKLKCAYDELSAAQKDGVVGWDDVGL